MLDDALKTHIDNEIASESVVLFMKGTPVFPQCGFSAQVIDILNYYSIKFSSYNVLDDNDLRQGIKDYSEWPTIPQIYIKNEFIGGCDILREMLENNEIEKLFEEKKISFSKSNDL